MRIDLYIFFILYDLLLDYVILIYWFSKINIKAFQCLLKISNKFLMNIFFLLV